MSAITEAVLMKALDGLAMRATVTAHNIANANSPGYRPLTVTFEDALRNAARQGVGQVDSVRPRVVPAFDSAGRPEMRLDLELATASSTAGRYTTLSELLNRQLQLRALAVSGTR
jgi:flagellar basal-body rod protein FlgB